MLWGLVWAAPAPSASAADVPTLTRPAKDARFFCKDLMVGIAWTLVAGATGYRLELAKDPDFDHLVASEETTETRSVFLPRAPGRYVLRVAAKDRDGHLSAFSAPAALHCEKDPPEDYLLLPEAGARLEYQKTAPALSFSWAAAPDHPSYRFILAKTEDLEATAVVRQVLTEARLAIPAVPDGQYFWGVYLEDALPYPLFLSPRLLTVRKGSFDAVTAPGTLKDWGKQ